MKQVDSTNWLQQKRRARVLGRRYARLGKLAGALVDRYFDETQNIQDRELAEKALRMQVNTSEEFRSFNHEFGCYHSDLRGEWIRGIESV